MVQKPYSLIRIPFCGFYESEADFIIQAEIERYLGVSEIPKDVYEAIDHIELSKDFSKAYVEMFQEYLKNNSELDISLKFRRLSLADDYDNRDDEIHCMISNHDLRKLWEATDKKLLSRFREYVSLHTGEILSGDWLKPVTEWSVSHNGILLECYLAQEELEDIDYIEMFQGNLQVLKKLIISHIPQEYRVTSKPKGFKTV